MSCSPTLRGDFIGKVMYVTSSTRPTGSNRYTGQYIFESDTARTLMYDGTGWVVMAEPPQSYTPSTSGLTVGAGGTVTGQSHRSDGFVDFWVRVTLGTAPTMGTLVVGIPYAYEGSANDVESGIGALFYDTSAAFRYTGSAFATTTTTVTVTAVDASGTYARNVNLSSTIPFTWAIGDSAIISGRYRMVNRYS